MSSPTPNPIPDSTSDPISGPALDPEWTSGDVTLKSSDGVSFKAHKHAIMTTSVVLRDMIQAFPVDAEAPEIPFCDETIETAATIRIFLGLSYSRLYKKHFTDESSAVIQVIAFLDKYECQMSKRLLEGETLKALMSDSVAPKDAFIIGALLESDELVKLVLRLHGTAPLGFYEYANFRIECDSCGCSNKSKKGRSIGHPVCSKCQCFKGTMRADVSHFSQLPAKYVCALVTANSAAVMGATFVTALKAFTNTVHQLETPKK